MIKTVVILFVLGPLVGLMVFLRLPAKLQNGVLKNVDRAISASLPYRVSVRRVTTAWGRGFDLEGVQLVSKDKAGLQAHAERVSLKLDWAALWRGQMIFSEVTWQKPVVHILLGPDHRPLLPATHSSGSIKWPFRIDHLRVFDGEVHVADVNKNELSRVALRNIQLDATLSQDKALCHRFDFQWGDGHGHMTGWLRGDDPPQVDLKFESRGLPLGTVLGLWNEKPAPWRLVHSGQTTFQSGPNGWRFQTQGTLDGGRLRLQAEKPVGRILFVNGSIRRFPSNAVRSPKRALGAGFLTADLEAKGSRVSLDSLTGTLNSTWVPGAQEAEAFGSVTAHFHFSNGHGDYEVQSSTGGLQASGKWSRAGDFWRTHTQIHAGPLVWKGRTLRKVSAHLFWNNDPHVPCRLELYGEGLDIHSSKNSWNIAETTWTLMGGQSTWQADWLVRSVNGWQIVGEGPVQVGSTRSRLTWKQLRAISPEKNTWTATGEGSLSWGPDSGFQLENLELAEGSQQFKLTYRIPGARSNRRTATVELHASASHWDPSMTNTLVPYWTFASGGVINFDIDLRKFESQWTGKAVFSGTVPEMHIPDIGLTLTRLVARLQLKNQILEIEQFTGRTPNGPIEITGRSRLPHLHFLLRAPDLPLQIQDRFKAVSDVNLELEGTLERPALSGKATLKSGLYEAPKKEKGARSRGETPTPSVTGGLWRELAMRLGILWDHGVWYRDGLTGIETRGDLKVKKVAGGPEVALSGAVTVLQGTYSYYGRDFQIESGQLQFLGPAGQSPLLTARALYRKESVTVYLDISGTLAKPELKLRSSPPMPDKDIVSILVFGRPLSELTSRTSGASANQELAKAAGNVIGSYVLKGLRQTGVKELNLDVLNIQPSEEGSRLVLGRYLTSNLFVRYDQSFAAQGEKSVIADWYVFPQWTLEAATGSEGSRHVDLLFRYPLNKGTAPPAGGAPRQSPFSNVLMRPLDSRP